MKLHFPILFAISILAVVAQSVTASPPEPCSFAAAPKVTSRSSPKTMTCNIDGEKREALVYAPGISIRGEKFPLVFAFHGHGGNMQGAAQSMNLQTLWPAAIVVYPQGLPTMNPEDPSALQPGWQQESGQNGDRDLKFFDTMLATMQQTHTIDDDRIYTTGFSNGGAFSFLLWAERGQILAAIGAVSGRTRDSVHLTRPRAFLAIAGENDKKIVDGEPRIDLQKKSIEKAREVDSATGPGQTCGQICTFYPSTTQTPVKTFIHPGGHVYKPWSSAEIVKFFKNHKHP